VSDAGNFWMAGSSPPSLPDVKVLLDNPIEQDDQIPFDEIPVDEDGVEEQDDNGPILGFVQSILHIEESNEIPTEIKAKLVALLNKYKQVCMNALRRSPIKVKVRLRQCWTTTSPNPVHRSYPLYGIKREHLLNEGNMLLEKGLAIQKPGVWSHPSIVVEKRKNNVVVGLRTVVNLVELNAQTARPRVTPLNIQLVGLKFKRSRVYVSADLFRAFKQLELHPDDRDFFGQSYPEPLKRLEPKRLPEGWSGSPMALQISLEEVFFAGPENLGIFVDDLGLGAESWDKLISQMDRVLELCLLHNVGLKDSITFGTSMQFAGCKFENGTVTRNPQTLGSIRTMVLETAAGLTKLIGFFVFFTGFIASLEINMRPLRQILLKCQQYCGSSKSSKLKHVILREHGWEQSYDDYLNKLYDEIEQRIAMHIPTPDMDTVIVTDASDDYGAGMISQTSPSERNVPIWERKHLIVMFYSTEFSATEKNYSTSEREFLVLVKLMVRGENLLRIAPFVEIFMDNANTVATMQSTTRNKSTLRRLLRQEAYVRSFPCKIVHIPGAHNLVDMFTRTLEITSPGDSKPGNNPDDDMNSPPIDNDTFMIHEHNTRLKQKQQVDRVISPIPDLRTQLNAYNVPITNRYGLDSITVPTLTDFGFDISSLNLPPPFVVTTDDLNINRLEDNRVVLPILLLEPMIWLAHQQVGHRGPLSTTHLLERTFYYPKLIDEVKRVVSKCFPCNENYRRHLQARPMGHPIVGLRVGEVYLVDVFYMPVAEDGSRYFTLFQCEVSKFMVAQTMVDRSSTSTRACLELLLQINNFLPQIFMRDQGTEFEASYKELTTLIGSSTHVHTENWKPSHGAVERAAVEIRRLIRILLRLFNMPNEQWHKLLVPAVWLYNNSPHKALDGKRPIDFMPLRLLTSNRMDHIRTLLQVAVPANQDINIKDLDTILLETQERFEDSLREIVTYQEELRTIRNQLWLKRNRIKSNDPNLVVGSYVMVSREASGSER